MSVKANEPLELTRREVIGTAARGGLVAAAPFVVPAAALGGAGRAAPSERIRLGLVGCGPMGRANLANCARYEDVEVVAVCDPWRERREAAAAAHPGAATYGAHEDLLARDDLDAVIVASPPHWHALHAVAVCEAGKDLYLQKPATLYPDEALAVRNAVRRHGVVCQVGTQIHAGENFRRVVELVRAGALGRVSRGHAFFVMNQGTDGLGPAEPTAPPEGLDWDRWVGPAPLRPFDPRIVVDAYHHCSFWDFSGGWTPGMAPHLLDLLFWALGLGFPRGASTTGGRFVLADGGDVPDVQECAFDFGDLVLTWTMSMVNSFGFDFGRGSADRRLGMYFFGVDGTLFADYGRYEISPEGEPREVEVERIPPSPGHEREWLDRIRDRGRPSCDLEYHTPIDLAIGLANLSYRLGRSVRFDPERERILDDEEARRLARPNYREPWRFPAEYLAG